MKNLATAAFALLCLLAAPAGAQQEVASGNPENWCRNGAFPGDGTDFRAARVSGGARLYFHGDAGDCPRRGAAACRTKKYLVPGDRVLLSRTYGEWVCGWYHPRRGEEVVGWLAASRLRVEGRPAAPEPGDWVGRWEYAGQTLDISRAGAGSLRVEGTAFWRGLGDNVHDGAVGAEAQPRGAELVLEEDGCRVELRLAGEFLVARDNSGCGGLNVRFNGVYRKRAGAPARRARPVRSETR